MMKLQDKLHECRNGGRAILATNFYNLETLQGILQAAREMQAPIILQLSESSINYIGLEMAVNMVRTAIKNYNVEAWLHLDHGNSTELTKRCLEAGFDSVMIDASERSFDENVKITTEVVKQAQKYGAHVEAELGYIAKLGQTQSNNAFTQPEDAKRFTELTGINSLAVAIGSSHGFYNESPNIQIELLEKIHQATTSSLVLHGGSGIPANMLASAVAHGISKINLATEIKDTFMRALRLQLASTSEIDLRKVFPTAINDVKELIEAKLKLLK
jgi:fructose-bisphosphate aldolase class II/tagatose 1,6-diphosphate aldolase GatY/KbaY